MILILATVAAVGALAACEEGADEGVRTVAASTGILAELAGEVGGDAVEVVQIVPDSVSPHDFQPSADDRQRLAEADLVVVNGAGLDATVPAEDANAPVWTLTEETPELLAFGGDAPAEEGEERDEGGDDPHVWMDPTRVAAALPSLAAVLGEVEPGSAAAFRRRADRLAAGLEDLSAEIERDLETVGSADRELVTSHDALAYFADRYGFEVVATAFPATGADAEPSAGALADVIEAVEATDARALFAEATDDPEALESVSSETGVPVVTDLLVESPGDAGTYPEMLRRDADLIADALGG
jgi:zinc/manganese transport system substrate-binding protein